MANPISPIKEMRTVPPQPSYDLVDTEHLNSKHGGNNGTFNSASAQTSDFHHLIPSKLCGPTPFSECAPSLNYDVPIVILNSSNPKVTGINAFSVVSRGAVVKNPFSFRDWTNRYNPTGHMRAYSSRKWITLGDAPVTTAGNCPDPYVAFSIGGVRYLFVETLNEVQRQVLRLEIIWGSVLRHIKSCIFAVLAPVRRQPTGAPLIIARRHE